MNHVCDTVARYGYWGAAEGGRRWSRGHRSRRGGAAPHTEEEGAGERQPITPPVHRMPCGGASMSLHPMPRRRPPWCWVGIRGFDARGYGGRSAAAIVIRKPSPRWRRSFDEMRRRGSGRMKPREEPYSRDEV